MDVEEVTVGEEVVSVGTELVSRVEEGSVGSQEAGSIGGVLGFS
jgi:hypothetical protein